MRKLEEKSQKNTRKTKMQKAILLTIASGGRIGGDLLVKQVIDSLLGTDLSTTSPRKSEIVKSAASRLRNKGLLTFKSGRYSLTSAGEKTLNTWQLSRYKISQPRKWDKKWRVIIFDIPEKRKGVRERVREVISSAGFHRLQDSVWVYPYDCEDIIGLMKIDFGIGKNLLYMIVDQIEDDLLLRMNFGLIQ